MENTRTVVRAYRLSFSRRCTSVNLRIFCFIFNKFVIARSAATKQSPSHEDKIAAPPLEARNDGIVAKKKNVNKFHKVTLLFYLFFAGVSVDLPALQPQDYVSNPLLNERAKSLYQQLKCPVCQGQSIAESDADMAIRMREEVRRLLQSGLSDMEIRDTFSENMGEDVLLQPSFGMRSFMLWLTPLIAGIIFTLFAWRRFHFNQYRKL